MTEDAIVEERGSADGSQARRRSSRSARWSLVVLLAGCVLHPGGALSQTASQITPRSFAPPIEGGLGGGVEVGAAPGLDTPAGAQKLFVTLRGVRVEGGYAALQAAAAEIAARLSGKRVSGADIFAAARALEAAYAEAGYVLVRVTLPKQRLVNGATLRLVVIDGYVERVETKNLPERVRARIAALMAPLVGKRGVTRQELERRILLAGDTPGVILRSALAPGSTTGATVLVVDAKYQAVNGIVSADNTLAASLGRYQIGVGADFNSVLGGGELIYLRATGDPNGGSNGFFTEDARNRILAAGVIAPLGDDGLTFNVEGTLARTTPLADDGIQSTDDFDRLSFRLRYPWIRSRDLNYATQIVFDVQDEEESLLASAAALPLFLDRLRILRFANEANYLASWGGTFSATLTPSFGLDVLGARTAGDATPTLPLSTAGANATFAKLAGTFGYGQSLAEHLAIALSANAQTSFNTPLSRSEQIGVAGPGMLSTFDAGTVQGDSGAVGRAEVSTPFALPPLAGAVGVVAAPYLFGAIGEVFLAEPTALEASHIRAASYGLGLRLGGAAAGSLSNGSLDLEFGREARSDGAPDGNRFTLVSSIRF